MKDFEYKYIDRRQFPKGKATLTVFKLSEEEMLEEELKNGWILDKIVDSDRGAVYIFRKSKQPKHEVCSGGGPSGGGANREYDRNICPSCRWRK